MKPCDVDVAPAEALPGFMHRIELRWLARQARTARTIVEVGCWQGRSTLAMADHCAGHIFAVDPWAGPYYCDDGRPHRLNTHVYEAFCAHLARHLDSGRVIPIRGAFGDVVRTLPQQAAWTPADLVFLDGDHRRESLSDNIGDALGLLRPGGILAGHDFGRADWPGVAQAVQEWFPREAEISHCRTIWWATV